MFTYLILSLVYRQIAGLSEAVRVLKEEGLSRLALKIVVMAGQEARGKRQE